MGGFLQALSALAPIAPAMSDAQDIRTARAAEQQKASLLDAQLAAQKLATEGEKQRQTQEAVPKFIGDPQWNPLTLSMQGVTLDPNTGQLALKDVPGGIDPVKRAQAIISEREQTTGEKLSPEEKQNIYDQTQGFKPLTGKVTPLTGAAGQPQEYPKGSGNYVVFGRGADGNIVTQPVPAGYTPPAPKPISPAAQYTNLLTKQILANNKQGPPLTNEEAANLKAAQSALDIAGITRAQAWAQAAAQNHLHAVTDPDTGMDTLVPVAQAVAAANSGHPYLAGTVSAPTGIDKKNQMLAQSALTQIDSMERVLASDPNLTGPGNGQLTKMQTWLGTNSEDAQQFLAAATFLSEHGVGVFGGRNIHSIEDLQNLMGSLKTNPAALKAALEQAKLTMLPWATAGGRLPAPRSAATPASPKPGAPKTASDYLKSIGVQ